MEDGTGSGGVGKVGDLRFGWTGGAWENNWDSRFWKRINKFLGNVEKCGEWCSCSGGGGVEGN